MTKRTDPARVNTRQMKAKVGRMLLKKKKTTGPLSSKQRQAECSRHIASPDVWVGLLIPAAGYLGCPRSSDTKPKGRGSAVISLEQDSGQCTAACGQNDLQEVGM